MLEKGSFSVFLFSIAPLLHGRAEDGAEALKSLAAKAQSIISANTFDSIEFEYDTFIESTAVDMRGEFYNSHLSFDCNTGYYRLDRLTRARAADGREYTRSCRTFVWNGQDYRYWSRPVSGRVGRRELAAGVFESPGTGFIESEPSMKLPPVLYWCMAMQYRQPVGVVPLWERMTHFEDIDFSVSQENDNHVIVEAGLHRLYIDVREGVLRKLELHSYEDETRTTTRLFRSCEFDDFVGIGSFKLPTTIRNSYFKGDGERRSLGTHLIEPDTIRVNRMDPGVLNLGFAREPKSRTGSGTRSMWALGCRILPGKSKMSSMCWIS